jgi:hypothetical protein
LVPLRVVYRRALRDGLVAVNPCVGVELPARDEERRTPPSKADAEKLLGCLPGAYPGRMVGRNPHSSTRQACRPCGRCSRGAYPGAYPNPLRVVLLHRSIVLISALGECCDGAEAARRKRHPSDRLGNSRSRV